MLLPHRWSIVCQHQSARNGRTVHSSAHGLLKRVGCFWMPQAHCSFQRHYWIEPIYLPLYHLRMHFLIYTSIWFFSMWRIRLYAALGLELLIMTNSCNEYVLLNINRRSPQNRCRWHHLSSCSRLLCLRYGRLYAREKIVFLRCSDMETYLYYLDLHYHKGFKVSWKIWYNTAIITRAAEWC